MKPMIPRWKKALGMGMIVAGLPASASAAFVVFRHVLPCILDITPQEGELAADFDHSTLWFKSSGVLRDLQAQTSPAAVRFPEIIENAQTIVFKTAGFAAKLTDGNVYTFPADTQVDRIQYSYGLGGVPVLNPGWVSVSIVPSLSTPGDAALSFQNIGSRHAGASRYLGMFYLMANASCSGTECTYNPTLPAACLDYTDPSQCPTGYGRLLGVPLHKVNQRYEYSIAPIFTATEQPTLFILGNIPPNSDRIRFAATAAMSFDLGFPLAVSPGSSWVPNYRSTIEVDTEGAAQSALMMVGHEEDVSLYE